MEKIELLSPAGNMKSLVAAIEGGCDAVYLAGKRFGARSFANNFDDDEIIEAIKLSHMYGVKVYITVNTLILDSEVDKFIDYIDFIHKNNVDAIIIQDIGMMDLIHKVYPNLEIHASTQMHIHNLEGAKLLSDLGIKRVVLARETPLDLIKKINNSISIETETFIHGALCMCYSGQCLMSVMIGNRSGNFGTCAQCCRQPYDLICNNEQVNSNKYLLSMKDLNTLEYIDKLIDAKINSLKIEGRMKSPEYVYLVTKIYRTAIDNYYKYGKTSIIKSDINKLNKVFNREFTKGFIFNENNNLLTNEYRPNHMGVVIGHVIDYKNSNVVIKLTDELNIGDGIRFVEDDIGLTVTQYNKVDNIVYIKVNSKISKNSSVVKTFDKLLMESINNEINKKTRKVLIKGRIVLDIDKKAFMEISDGINTVCAYGDIVLKSINKPLTKDDISKQLNKLGNTIYEFDELEIVIKDNIFIKVSSLNEIRRNVIDLLNKKRLYNIEYKKERYSIKLPDFKIEHNKNILLSNTNDYRDNYNSIYVTSIELYNKLNKDNSILKIIRVNEHLNDYNIPLLVGELGSIYKYKNVSTDFSLNVTNSYAVAFLHSLGVKRIALSYELNYIQVKELIDNYETRYNKHPNLEVIVSSYPEVMVCKYNLLKKYNVNEGYLRDRFSNLYKIKIEEDLMHIYNYKKLVLKDDYFKIGVNNIRINEVF